jgi:hypothetical protein
MNGTIVSITRAGNFVTGSVRVNEGDGRGPVEYVATVPAVDLAGLPRSSAEIKDALVNAWQAQRAGRPAPPQDLSGQINGPVNL